MNGAQHCPECGSKMSVKDTGHGGEKTYRIAECPCGIRVETVECQLRRLPVRMPHMPGMAPAAANGTGRQVSQGPPDTAISPPASAGGVGGGLPSDLSSGSDPKTDSALLSNPDQTRAKSKAAAIDYPKDFVILWEQTGRHGIKFHALRAWMKAGRPSWLDVQETWRAYLLSERPVAGFVKDLSSWLNGRCHQQEWAPAGTPARRPVTAIETFDARRKREHEEASERESDRLIWGAR